MSKITTIQIKDLSEQKRAKIEVHLSIYRSNMAEIERHAEAMRRDCLENMDILFDLKMTPEEVRKEIG